MYIDGACVCSRTDPQRHGSHTGPDSSHKTVAADCHDTLIAARPFSRFAFHFRFHGIGQRLGVTDLHVAALRIKRHLKGSFDLETVDGGRTGIHVHGGDVHRIAGEEEIEQILPLVVHGENRDGFSAGDGERIDRILQSVIHGGGGGPQGIDVGIVGAVEVCVVGEDVLYLAVAEITGANTAVRGGIVIRGEIGQVAQYWHGMVDILPEKAVVLGVGCFHGRDPAVVPSLLDACVAAKEIIVHGTVRHVIDGIVPGHVHMIPAAVYVDHVPDVVHGVADGSGVLNAKAVAYSHIDHRVRLTNAAALFEHFLRGMDLTGGLVIFVVHAEIIAGQQQLADGGAGLVGIADDLVQLPVEGSNPFGDLFRGILVLGDDPGDDVAVYVIAVAAGYVEQLRMGVQQPSVSSAEVIKGQLIIRDVNEIRQRCQLRKNIGVEIRQIRTGIAAHARRQ